MNFIKAEEFTDSTLVELISDDKYNEELAKRADKVRKAIYGSDVYVRGLIEFSNYCKNDCYYCGIRRSNKNIERYRLDFDELIMCAKIGYKLGYRTFVLQGGEDMAYKDDDICRIVEEIKKIHPDCAITLSLGERSKNSYRAFYNAGADRYLLREETSNRQHYYKIHPSEMSFENRRQCLFDLKEIGFQVGGGFMVGSPYQEDEDLVKDLRFLQELEPDMVGIGPYISQHDTPFKDMENGSYKKTLRLVSILRLMFPYCLIPATTALGTINPFGREEGLRAGANVLMPNLSPTSYRELYSLYDNKICTGDEAAECRSCLELRVKKAGYNIVTARGDVSKTKRFYVEKRGLCKLN
ncbi:[FeFe] hydrogenase H-cluster radical SAM maturase HydE [Anaerococcus sp. AGMB00486]|uniref:[FeFe] hydrogenase H-cluster radical SAM maturase HydE n=1 Tax=Anaerococcus faecalis TaxID=2742993 RepID=A0ABX2N9R9_9FIRM|nr:[FeFe] hydrogenase H-cluster radical SAM maturase HydE [Anaerococcus faecalis]NVF11430.1 [FeFe] hydrogenase H-cluster radical SAM maturase HydE [Anaerococcus faecalis]